MGRKCVGFVEAVGLAAALQAADTIAKSANVRLLGYEYSGYDGHILIKFEGNAGAIKAAADSLRQAAAGYKSAGKVGWPLGAERLLYPRIVLCNMFT